MKLVSWLGLFGSVGAATAFLTFGGCSGGNKHFDDANDAGTDDGGNLEGSADDSPVIFMMDGSMCPTHCSGDLHTIVDCNNNAVGGCPGDMGCLAGACVAACDAAKANKSTIGCDYYAVNEDTTFSAGACFAAFIANTWDAPITISVDFNGMSLNAASFTRVPKGTGQAITYQPLTGGQLQSGEIGIVFLAQGPNAPALYTPACPPGITPGVTSDPAPHGTVIAHAFHIQTNAPVVAYDIFPYGGGISAITSATLLIPTTAWDTNYIAVDAYKSAASGESNDPFVDIVAQENGTHITISPTAAIVGGTGVAATAQGTPVTYTLNKGELLNIIQDAELNGSPIQSDKPIGVWGGNSCMDVPIGVGACDAAHQQIPPVKALGYEYVASRYRDRFAGVAETPPWHIVGAVNGTNLKYDPAPPAMAPTTLSSGQIVEFPAAGPFVVKSQDAMHPFYLSNLMTGCGQVDTTGADCRGDPEFVNVIPPQQYLSDYIFFTDPTYPETNLIFVRAKAADGTFKDVTLDCAGKLGGWKPVGSGGNYQTTSVDLVTGNFQKVGGCDNGRHEAKSDGAFGLTVWGWGSAATGGQISGGGGGFYSQYVSYGYPAGASVQSINTVVVPPTPR